MTVLGQSSNTYFGTDDPGPAQRYAALSQPAALVIHCVENEGPVKKLSLPSGWALTNTFSGDGGKWRLQSFSAFGSDECELRIYCRGNEHTMATLLMFDQVLEQTIEGDHRRVDGAEIAIMQEIMGPLVGNNQYTNHNPVQSRCAPDCHLTSVMVETLGRKPVLTVDGIFIERTGKAGLRFRNSFVRESEHSQLIFEFLLQAPIRHFEFFGDQLRASMSSIEWA